MTTFKYKAMDAHGKTLRGHMDAVNSHDLETRLNNMAQELITVAEAGVQPGFIFGKRITRTELINFCFHMEQLTAAGVPILDALIDLRDSVDNPRFREIISSIVVSIEGGRNFSQALAEFPKVFDEVFVSLVEAGEFSGQLSKVLANLTESIKYQDELIAQTKKLIMYPAFVGSVVVGVIFFLMLYLVPQMISFIQTMGEELPFHTIALIYVSDFFINYWYIILIAPIATFTMVIQSAKVNKKVRYRLDWLKLHLWLIGPILRKIILGRFATYFALLYSSGVTVLSCVKISEKITGNAVIAQALSNVRKDTSEGQNLSASIEKSKLFPPLVLRMLKVGENTGNLDTALLNVSYFYNRDVKESIQKLQTMIEPIMTIILGVVLGWVMMSVLGPIYDIIAKIKT